MDRQPDHGDGRAERVQLPVGERPALDHEDEDDEGRGGQERHEVVPDRQGQDEDHQEDEVVILPLPQVVPPVEREPGEQRDGEERDGVDLLVDVRLAPDGEGGGTHEHGQGGGDEPEPPVGGERCGDPVDDEEPAAVGEGAHGGAEEVDADGDGESEGCEEELPGAREDDEGRVPGRVGDAEDVRGRDVLAGVPEGGGGGQRDEVQEPHRDGGDGGGQVRGSVVGPQVVHRVQAAGLTVEISEARNVTAGRAAQKREGAESRGAGGAPHQGRT